MSAKGGWKKATLGKGYIFTKIAGQRRKVLLPGCSNGREKATVKTDKKK